MGKRSAARSRGARRAHPQPVDARHATPVSLNAEPRVPVEDLLLTPEEVAVLLKVRVELLYKWRYAGEGPPSFKVGRYVRYRSADVLTWLDSQAG
jgi:predicted DNA-binding transcriptional regulator AlpA